MKSFLRRSYLLLMRNKRIFMLLINFHSKDLFQRWKLLSAKLRKLNKITWSTFSIFIWSKNYVLSFESLRSEYMKTVDISTSILSEDWAEKYFKRFRILSKEGRKGLNFICDNFYWNSIFVSPNQKFSRGKK